MRKLTTLLLVVFLLIPGIVQAAVCFPDLVGFDVSLSQPICALKEEGVIQGYPDGSFNPNWQTSKGEFLKLVVLPPLHEKLGDSLNMTGTVSEILSLAVREGLSSLDVSSFHPEERIRRREAVEYIIDAYQLDYTQKGLLGYPFQDIDALDDFDENASVEDQYQMLPLHHRDVV